MAITIDVPKPRKRKKPNPNFTGRRFGECVRCKRPSYFAGEQLERKKQLCKSCYRAKHGILPS